jgi:hypothetical protein
VRCEDRGDGWVLDDVVERELVGGLREAPDELEHLAAVPPAAMAYAHDGEMLSDTEYCWSNWWCSGWLAHSCGDGVTDPDPSKL